MEPRARAAKNVGKMNFSHNECMIYLAFVNLVSQADLLTPFQVALLLYAHGDVRNPLPETVKVLDEILTEFMQGVAFEAARVAQYTGRQKIKYDDVVFAIRKNPAYLGKVQEMMVKKLEIDTAKKIFSKDDEAVWKDATDGEASRESQEQRSTNGKVEEELGEADDDAEAEADALGRKK
jgi:transcription initiation factor TFIID subunit 13